MSLRGALWPDFLAGGLFLCLEGVWGEVGIERIWRVIERIRATIERISLVIGRLRITIERIAGMIERSRPTIE